MPGMPSSGLDFPTALGALVKVYGQAPTGGCKA